ncbi:MAG: MFS transporter [Bacteroidota bacterium]
MIFQLFSNPLKVILFDKYLNNTFVCMDFKSSIQIFKHKEFRWFVFGRFFLTIALQMQMSTICLQIYYEFTDDVLTQGLLGLTEALPFIVTSFFSGHVADIVSRKRILLMGCVALFIGSVFLFAYSTSLFQGLLAFGTGPLFVVVFLFGITRSFLAVSITPFMSQIIPRKFYTQSTTWNTTAWHLGAILGPVLAGILYGYSNSFHANWCYGTNCVLFLLAIFFYTLIASRPIPVKNKTETFKESISAGIKFVFKNKLILSVLSLDLFAVLFGGAVALIPSFTDKILHLGPESYGLLRTAPAFGAVLMALYLFIKPPGKKAGVNLLISVSAFGVFTILFALCTNYWLAFAMLLLTGAFDNISVVIRHSILQLSTPDEMRGRVSAVNNIFIGSSNEIGAFESGVTARLLGLVPSIIFGGAATIMVVLGIRKLNPKLEKLDLTKLE